MDGAGSYSAMPARRGVIAEFRMTIPTSPPAGPAVPSASAAMPAAGKVLRAARVLLRPPCPADVAGPMALGRDPDITRLFGVDPTSLPPLTEAAAARWVEGLPRHPHAWVVEHGGRLLGEVRLDGLDQHDRRARLAVGFYDPARLGMGLGRDTVRLVLAHAFGTLGLHRVGLRVAAANTRAIRCYRACGFVVEGREREAFPLDGAWHDDLIMGVLAAERPTTDAVPLTGGRTNPGAVRIGDAVRRSPTPNSDFVHRLLRHLQTAGFDGAPRSLGRDGEGRDLLGWIEGEVPAELSPAYGDDVLAAAARLVRRYHEATAPLLAAAAARSAGLEVVCHNDLSPCNAVFRSGMPVALIDFDAAVPGTRAHDLGYAAWLWLDFGSVEVSAGEQRRRLQVFLGAYGPGPSHAEVVTAVLHRQEILAARARSLGDGGMARWAAGCLAWSREHFSSSEAPDPSGTANPSRPTRRS